MKKAIFIICMAFVASTLISANEKFEKKMNETISQFNSCTSVADFQNLANKFRIIANVETKEWLPLYYEANCYILMSLMDQLGIVKKDEYLDQAHTSIERMLELAPGESEAYVLNAFYHTGRLVVNPPERAQSEGPMVSAALGKALVLDPNNPRAALLKLLNEIGTAQYFGSDISTYCRSAQDLLANWDSYSLKSSIHPAWGKDQVEEIVWDCGK